MSVLVGFAGGLSIRMHMQFVICHLGPELDNQVAVIDCWSFLGTRTIERSNQTKPTEISVRTACALTPYRFHYSRLVVILTGLSGNSVKCRLHLDSQQVKGNRRALLFDSTESFTLEVGENKTRIVFNPKPCESRVTP